MSGAAWLAAAVVALCVLMAGGGVAMFVRDLRQQRVARHLQGALQARAGASERQEQTPPAHWWSGLEILGRRLSDGRLGALLLAGEDRLLLDQAGWNDRTGTALYLGARVTLALFFALLAVVLAAPRGPTAAVAIVGALAAGVLLPKIVLRSWAARIRKRAAEELPLLVDLLRLLQGVGFSMDQSLQMLGEQLGGALPVLGRELREANTAYARGRSRPQSLRRLGESFGSDDLRSLVQVIVQVSQHGGSVQEPLRQFAERLREQRRASLKERVGKLSVKMTVVMMLTLLPALMLVLGGPAIIALSSAMSRMN
ncbi:type II secretion system F family protein [Luteimonas abyssi]|uniref:type II secretion system F family protein n=1 Tax=Luteimonas abyssi TaxID=1247514 RepID=UPI000737D4DE|nr:type II secretion system F family protein [Luteimonas abyssi]